MTDQHNTWIAALVPVQAFGSLVWSGERLDVRATIHAWAAHPRNERATAMTFAAFTCELERDIFF